MSYCGGPWTRFVREFEFCLRCGQPLRSWLSRQSGFGLQCWEATPPAERQRLVTMAHAIQADLDLVGYPPRSHRAWRVLLDRLKVSWGARS